MYDKVIYRIGAIGAFRDLPDSSKFLVLSALLNYQEQFTCAQLRKFLKASGYPDNTLSSVKEFYQFIRFMDIGWSGPEVSYE